MLLSSVVDHDNYNFYHRRDNLAIVKLSVSVERLHRAPCGVT